VVGCQANLVWTELPETPDARLVRLGFLLQTDTGQYELVSVAEGAFVRFAQLQRLTFYRPDALCLSEGLGGIHWLLNFLLSELNRNRMENWSW